MDKVFVRNYVLFVVILLFTAGTFIAFLVQGERELQKTDILITHSQDVIKEAEQISRLVEGMLGAQRGYILTNSDIFQNQYEAKKSRVSRHIANLTELTGDNQSQQSRLDEIRQYFVNFSTQLEARANTLPSEQELTRLDDVEVIDQIKSNIIRINQDILSEEYGLLNDRGYLVESKKKSYFQFLILSVAVGTVLLLIFNGFLFHTQRKKSSIEGSLKISEDRFILALEGTEDGIFDWDVKTDKVFYSRRFFSMLGYDRSAGIGTKEDFENLLHPEDSTKIQEAMKLYLTGDLSEYKQEFRMKHESGRWVWIQSRAKALFDKSGKAYRMVGAHTDVTHMIKAQEKLEHEKEQAEAANKAKSEFLAHMSHEIRTPLTAISGIAEILQKNQDALNEREQKLVSTLSNSSSSLKDLINDVLDFSRIESGEVELEEEVFSLETLFEEVISMMALKASEKGISFVCDYKDVGNLMFYGDRVRLRQIVVNLIGNAIKFTDQGGVTIKAYLEDRGGVDFLRIDVSDTGIGIDPDNFDLVFERFKQTDSSVSRKYGGTGLGLPISKNLAEMMGGRIFLSSQLDEGSTFSVLLPSKIALDNDQKENVVDKSYENKINDKIRSIAGNKTKVLLAEDYEGNVVVITYILDELGLNYDVAGSGKAALEQWKNNHYDLILMDIQMPEMDGFTTTQEIRKLEKQDNVDYTPIIGMTAHALVGDRDKCIESGMDSYLPKPIVEVDFKKELLKFLQEKKKAA